MKWLKAWRFHGRLVLRVLKRPYAISWRTLLPATVLALLVPGYIFIGVFWTPGRILSKPEIWLDRAWPVEPFWALVYGSLYVFILLPFFVVRQEQHLRRVIWAYLIVWLGAFVFFLGFPTVAARPERVAFAGFFNWALNLVYRCDPPHNCFPSLHVAQAIVAAVACSRVHVGVGVAAWVWVGLISLSTLFTKQHYVADVIGGAALAWIAYMFLLRKPLRERIPSFDRRSAPAIILVAAGTHLVAVAGFWIAYQLGAEPK